MRKKVFFVFLLLISGLASSFAQTQDDARPVVDDSRQKKEVNKGGIF
jgi:hypothetical protein